ncbi:hypothetical protein Tco_0434388 [Tanacetum coccineum]
MDTLKVTILPVRPKYLPLNRPWIPVGPNINSWLALDQDSWFLVLRDGKSTQRDMGAELFRSRGLGTQKFIDKIGELRAISGHMLRAAGVQIPENNLDDLHSSREEYGTSETMDPQDLLGSFLLADKDLIHRFANRNFSFRFPRFP